MYSLCSVPFVFSWCLKGLEVPACLLFWREPKKGLLSGLGLTALKERRQCGGSQNESRRPPGGTEDWDRQDPVAQSRDCALTVNTGLLSLEEVVHPSTGLFPTVKHFLFPLTLELTHAGQCLLLWLNLPTGLCCLFLYALKHIHLTSNLHFITWYGMHMISRVC